MSPPGEGLRLLDGRDIARRHEAACDFVVVGSGPAGSTVARGLACAGAAVVVVEEGPFVAAPDLPEDGFEAMARLYRDMGASLLMGRAPMLCLQGRAVGGGSLINGAISWRLPRDVHEGWVQADPALADALPWEEIEQVTDRIEAELCIAPTDPAIAGPKNLLMARGAEALGLEHRPISRNVRGCRGLGRCLQGCPEGRKVSMDRSYLVEACAAGAEVLCATRVRRVLVDGGRATGVEAAAVGGGSVRVAARRGVVLAASALQSPELLLRSGLRQGPVGQGLQCHPGASMVGRFAEPVRAWTGATQGHEVIGLRREGIKFEALGYDLPIVAMRAKGFGRSLARDIDDLAHTCHWGVAVRAEAQGRVRAGRCGAAARYDLGRPDMVKLRRGLAVLGEMMLAAGAEHVCPGVAGWPERVADRAEMACFGQEGPLDPRAYTLAATHLFGTCRMGSDPARSVVRPDFRHHRVDRLYVADSSVFPSNTGVNPQTSIIALATLCADRVLRG